MSKMIQADCREALVGLEARSVDSVITDTPYEYKGGFMGQSWDKMALLSIPTSGPRLHVWPSPEHG